MGRYCPPVHNSAIMETHCCNAIFFSKGFFFFWTMRLVVTSAAQTQAGRGAGPRCHDLHRSLRGLTSSKPREPDEQQQLILGREVALWKSPHAKKSKT